MIPKEFKDTIQLYGEYESIFLNIPNKTFIIDVELFNGKKSKDQWHLELCKSFEKDYKYCSINNIYFTGCGYECYLNHYQSRLENYLKDYSEATEIDFLLKEYNLFINGNIFDFAPNKLKEVIEISYRKQIEFLENQISKTGYEFFEIENGESHQKFNYRKKQPPIKEDPFLDLSDTSLSEKIIYLELLGIINFIRTNPKHGTSTNIVSNVISAITGGKPETIQSYINPIDNPSVDQKNNPLNKKKNVLKVKNKLIELGFKVE